MPELPEVETVRRGLEPHLEGRVIARAEARRPDLRWPLPPDLVQVLTGARVVALRRRSKYILAELEHRGSLLLHLGMSGRMLIEDESQGAFHRDPAILPRHDHVVFWTDRGTRITFNDARRFGMVDLVAPGATHPLLAHLGPEPLSDAFTPEALAAALAGRRMPIKAALLDQRIVAGLGNIYVAEALYRAHLSPKRRASTLATRGGRPTAHAVRLVEAIREVLNEAIAVGGSTLRDHRQPDGNLGYFQHSFRVYDHEGAPCTMPGCGGTIRRFAQHGRSTFWCAKCQR